MMLGVALMAAASVGVIGYSSGRAGLEAAAMAQLTTIREFRAQEIEQFFTTVSNDVLVDANLMMVRDASKAFNKAFADLKGTPLSDDQWDELLAYYSDYFVPQLDAFTQDDYSAAGLIPISTAGRYLQYHYTAQYKDYDESIQAPNAGDGSEWSAVRDLYHDHFQRLVDSLGYEDFLLLDLNGNVVYTPYSGIDLGTNVESGPYSRSHLAAAYEQARKGSPDSVIITDLEWYVPSFEQPTLWVMTPIMSGGQTTGVLAAQVPLSAINNVMTGGNGWKDEGLQETGEVYLVGPDKLMRSVSRTYAEDQGRYEDELRNSGTPDSVLKRVEQLQTTVLIQPVDTDAVSLALRGETGEVIGVDYTGEECLTAYMPLRIGSLGWAAVASIETSEAFSDATWFARTVVLALLVICLVISLLAMALSRFFTRPIERLADAVEQVAQGDLGVHVSDDSRDEVGELARAFNSMSHSLELKQGLVDEQRAENERLLTAIMPTSDARRYRAGEENIAADRADVAVVDAILVGFDQCAAGMSSEDELARLRQLLHGFNEAAQRTGTEPMRTWRGRYLASSGLVTPRVDSPYRAVELAVELGNAVERFNAQTGAGLTLRVGVAVGRVRCGLIDRSTLAYDMWGEAVDWAHRVRDAADQPGVYVSGSVQERMADTGKFVQVGAVETACGRQTVWRVE
ncbi:MAG: HAMP domain-containing protein [Propionibacteriaceae bacterium]|nr:HAMP domain-containing protein [Propionibacteriaceae bacterium]